MDNMDYELAKKLKDTGFPQTTKEGFNVTTISAGGVHFPTLEELIEACGDKFYSVSRLPQKDFKDAWGAYSTVPKGINVDGLLLGRGSTPLEAVANLYIALNTK